ncbi:MAG TPA: patatin-like phospholipase family protein [Gemmatimonadaceae bacterium]
MKIQLAVQGGGAKLYGLLAALEAVQQLEKDGKVEVTRIAGTSAGAIAAALFAADVNLAELRQRIIDNRSKLAKMFRRPGTASGLWTLASGRPIADLAPVRELLDRLLGRKKEFGDLRVPLIVLATDLTNGKPHIHDRADDKIVSSILNSCAIPFYFRGPGKKNGGDLLVDGGICENFPVDVLRPFEERDGPVLGITFDPLSTKETPSNVASFARALLDAAMDNSVRRAQRQLGRDRLFSISTDITTFDFERALHQGMGDSYLLVRNGAKEFFLGFADRTTREQAAVKPTVIVEADREDFDSDTTLQAHADLFKAQHAGVKMKYSAVRMLVRSGGLGGDLTRPDLLVYRLTFGASSVPLQCVRVGVVEESKFTFLRTLRTEVVDRSFRRRPTIDLRARDKASPDSRAYLLFFNPTIQPNDPDAPFTLEYSHHVTGLLSDLASEGVDVLSFETSRSDGVTPEILLLALLPRSHPGYSMRPSADTTSTDKGRLLTDEEKKKLSHELLVDPDLYLVGWVGTNVEPNCEFAGELFAPGH